jgi:hypothetical protein
VRPNIFIGAESSIGNAFVFNETGGAGDVRRTTVLFIKTIFIKEKEKEEEPVKYGERENTKKVAYVSAIIFCPVP